MTATARAARPRVSAAPRPLADPSRSAASTLRRPRLRVVPAPRRQAPRAPFIVLIIAMLGGGLLAVLVLNTQRAQDAFTLTAIQKHNAQLTNQMQSLRSEVQKDQTPATMASRAAAIGMVPGADPIFVDPAGKILGIGTSGIVPLTTGRKVGNLVVIGQARPNPAPVPAPTIAPVSAATATAPTVTPTTTPAARSSTPAVATGNPVTPTSAVAKR